MAHLTYERCTPVMIVERVEPTRDFFRDRLGFAQTMEVPHGEGLGFVTLEKDSVEIMVQSRASVEADAGPDALARMDETIGKRGAVTLYLQVSDVDVVIPQLADADVLLPPRKTFYGTHEITVLEPGGHAVTFASRVK